MDNMKFTGNNDTKYVGNIEDPHMKLLRKTLINYDLIKLQLIVNPYKFIEFMKTCYPHIKLIEEYIYNIKEIDSEEGLISLIIEKIKWEEYMRRRNFEKRVNGYSENQKKYIENDEKERFDYIKEDLRKIISV